MAIALYADILNFVSSQSTMFIGSKTQAVANAIKPAVVTLMGCYIILWGLAHIRGLVQEPIMEFVMRIVKMVAIVGIGISLWGYNDYVVDTFTKSPDTLAAAMGGGTSTTNTLDNVLDKTFTIGSKFWEAAGLKNIGGYLAALLVWLVGIIVTAYAAFLIILSKIFLAVLVALGPIFIALLLFDTTAKFFESWIAQMANYALVVPLVVAVNIFILGMFQSAADQAALIGEIKIMHIFPLLVTAVVSVLVLAQIPNVASGLAGGIAMSSYGMGRKMLGKAADAGAYAGKKSARAAGKAAAAGAKKGYQAYKARRNTVKGEKSSGAGRTKIQRTHDARKAA